LIQPRGHPIALLAKDRATTKAMFEIVKTRLGSIDHTRITYATIGVGRVATGPRPHQLQGRQT